MPPSRGASTTSDRTPHIGLGRATAGAPLSLSLPPSRWSVFLFGEAHIKATDCATAFFERRYLNLAAPFVSYRNG